MNEDYKNLPVEQDAALQGKPLTLREKIFLGVLIGITSLWTVFLCKGLEWLVVWLKSGLT
jgi:hypothetical protein